MNFKNIQPSPIKIQDLKGDERKIMMAMVRVLAKEFRKMYGKAIPSSAEDKRLLQAVNSFGIEKSEETIIGLLNKGILKVIGHDNGFSFEWYDFEDGSYKPLRELI